MPLRTLLHLAIVVFSLTFLTEGVAQTLQQVSTVQADNPREEYLKRQEDFASRLNLTTSQKEQYKSLIEKRNTAYAKAQSGMVAREKGSPMPSKSQVLETFQNELHAMLTEAQRTKLMAEKAAAKVY